MKEKITAFIQGLITYDYILFGGVFILFILFIVLSILFRKKLIFSLLLLTISFTVLFAGPTIGYFKMHQFLFKNSLKLISQKRLSFVKAVVVKGTLVNKSKYDFKSCNITASAYKVSKNKLKSLIYSFKPLKKMSIIEENILKDETREFKIIVEPFNYTKDYNISISARCK